MKGKRYTDEQIIGILNRHTLGSKHPEGSLERCVAALNQQYFEHFEGFSEHGIFHGITF